MAFLSTHSPESSSLLWSPALSAQMKIIGQIQISPDNSQVLFVVLESDMSKEENVVISRIYKKKLFSHESAVPFSAENVISMQPQWSPNGKWIAFLSIREGKKNIYMASSDGGEAVNITKQSEDIQTFSWSPDSEKIAFVMAENVSSFRKDEAFIYNSKPTINRLWVLDVFIDSSKSKPLTTDDYCVRGVGDFETNNIEFDWSIDSKKITFAYSPTAKCDHIHIDSSIATVELATGVISVMKKEARFEAMPRYSPDGQSIAYLYDDSKEIYALNRRVAIYSFDSQERYSLAPTSNEGPLLAGPNLLGWNKAGNGVFLFEPKETKFHIVQLNTDGFSLEDMFCGTSFFKDPSLSYDKTMLGMTIQTPSTPPEAFVTKIDKFEPIQVSSFNNFLLKYPKIDTEVISWLSADNLSIQGLLTYPIGYDKNKKYPLLLVIHGGPMGVFSETFIGMPNVYPLAAFAQSGFMILRVNPRGSTGYGRSFRCANFNDWGGLDFDDLMSGIDMLIAKGLVDQDNLGVMGWSYGGYMTAWIITQTSRFKAASMGAGLCNLVSMNGTTDLCRFLTNYLGSFTHFRERYEKRSPLYYVDKISTPCLIQHGIADKRVPVSQSYEFYEALKRLNKKTALHLYPNMEHRLSNPKMELHAMESNLNWFYEEMKMDQMNKVNEVCVEKF